MESKETTKTCPNCKYERQPKDDDFVSSLECPKCGVIYSKAKVLNEKKGELAEDSPKEEDKNNVNYNSIEESESNDYETINCPYCAEVIKAEAIKCRFCGESLIDDPVYVQHNPIPPKKKRIGCGMGIGIIILSIIVGVPLIQSIIPIIAPLFPPEESVQKITPSQSKMAVKMPVSKEIYSYKIISAERFRDIKCVLTIRLSEKISREDLHKLALKLYKNEHGKYERVFITYYLPGMDVNSMAWATTHFNPNLSIQIFGTTIEEEKRIHLHKREISMEFVGSWFGELYGKYIIYKKDDTYILQTIYKDGSGGTDNLVKFKKDGKTAFRIKNNCYVSI